METILEILNVNDLSNTWVSETWESSLNNVSLPPNVSSPNVKQLKKLAEFLKVNKTYFDRVLFDV